MKRILSTAAALTAGLVVSLPAAASATGDGGGGRFTIHGGHFTAYSCKFHHRGSAGGYNYECISGAHYTGATMGYYGGVVCARSRNDRWTWYSRPC